MQMKWLHAEVCLPSIAIQLPDLLVTSHVMCDMKVGNLWMHV
jgi:hypothetical protein